MGHLLFLCQLPECFTDAVLFPQFLDNPDCAEFNGSLDPDIFWQTALTAITIEWINNLYTTDPGDGSAQ